MKTQERKKLLKAVLQGDRATVNRLTKVEPVKVEFTDYGKQRIALLNYGLSQKEVDEYMAKQPTHKEMQKEVDVLLKNLQNE